MKNALSIQSTNQLVKLNLGQHHLLNSIQESVKLCKPLTFDDILDCYCRGVRHKYTKERYKYIDVSPNRREQRFSHYDEYDIKDEYNKNSSLWIYTLRPIIKQWFVNNIGVLVIKGNLLVLPVMEVD